MDLLRKSVMALVLLAVAGLFQTAALADTGSYPDWMTQNRGMLQGFAINDVVLLGSHDAASCDVYEGDRPVTGYLTHHGKHIHRHARAKDVDSAVCQSGTITEQLTYGVRYFDMRIARQDGQYWACHMWLSTPLLGDGEVFTQFQNYVNAHPGEIIILNFWAMYGPHEPMDSKELSEFYNLLDNYFGAQLVPRGEFDKMTLGDIWNGTARIIAIGDSSADNTARQVIWDEKMVDSKWMNAQSVDSLFERLQERVLDDWQRGACKNKLRILQAMQTAGHKLSDAAETDPAVLLKLNGSWRNYPLNIIQVDDSVNSGLMPAIINLNSRRAAKH